MKSNLLSLAAILTAGTLILSGCCNNDTHSKAKQFCLDNGGTYSVVTSAEEEYGECMFPSGIGCQDEMIINGECNREADLSNIDTAEERQTGCENNVDGRMQDMMEGVVYFGIEWNGDEEEIRDEEGNLTMITRDFYAKYDRDGQHWKLPGRCEANFIDGSNGTTYGQEFMDDGTIDDVEVKLDWNGSSEVYSNGDLQAAVNKIANYLDVKVEFQQISYQGDKESANQLSYCQKLNPKVDECVFFKTNFYVPEQDAVMAGAFEPNKTITDYEWYLGRTASGEWKVLTAGY